MDLEYVLTFDEIFTELFPLPYDHGKWLNDQYILIERLRSAGDPYLTKQANKLQTHQEANQASIVMLDIVVDRVKKHLTTEKSSDNISIVECNR
jgi:hypothetical protein